MPAFLPIPEGLEIPEGAEQFDLVTTYVVQDGQLYPVAVDGIPFPGLEPEEVETETETEMGAEAAMGYGGGATPNNFMAAVEAAMKRPR
jgi:hypothetical protein